ncbi:MAG TPA: TIGR02679 domain-containing protein [Jiangellales bacterium]|nr:TIGR02679 domain-containing protein [Jiangellales bacterium]
MTAVPSTPADPDWARLLAKARRSLERTGGSLDASVGLSTPTDGERRVVIGITGVHRPAGVRRIAVRLADVDVHLRQASGRGLVETLAGSGSDPLRDRPAERRREAQLRDAALDRARTSALAGTPWFDRWLWSISGDGTLTRLLRAGGDLGPVLRVIEALPVAEEPMPVFAERVLGDTKAFADPTLRSLTVRALAAWQQVAAPSAAEGERDLWESVGVVPDDLASQVLVLSLPAQGGVVGEWLTRAAGIAMPTRLTLHQLRSAALYIDVEEIFVTENPAVLRAAVALGPSAPPLVCTEGVPSVAVHRLLAAAPSAVLRWRNDFDWPGVRMLTAARARYGERIVPWRMSAADYLSAAGDGPSLGGTPATTPWDAALANAMRDCGRTVMEERLLPVLLDDLRSAACRRSLRR